MSDITINDDKNQDNNQKTTPVTGSTYGLNRSSLPLSDVILQFWQGYMDEDRTFYSVSENAILGGGNV